MAHTGEIGKRHCKMENSWNSRRWRFSVMRSRAICGQFQYYLTFSPFFRSIVGGSFKTEGFSSPTSSLFDFFTVTAIIIIIINTVTGCWNDSKQYTAVTWASEDKHTSWVDILLLVSFYLSLMPHLKITLGITNLFRWQEWVTKSSAASTCNCFQLLDVFFWNVWGWSLRERED